MKRKITIALAGIALALVLTELLLRILEIKQYQKVIAQEVLDQYKKVYSDERQKPYLFGHQANIRQTLDDGKEKYTVVTNSSGLREEKDYETLETSIIFLGDSVVEGSAVENHEAMDQIFEERTGITSLNFGLGSAGTVQEYLYLKEKYQKRYNARLIILGFTLNDFEQNTFLRYFDPQLGNWRLYEYLPDKTKGADSPLAAFFKDQIKKSKAVTYLVSLFNSSQKESSKMSIPSVQIEQTEIYINKIKEFARIIDAEFLVVIFPMESQLKGSIGNEPQQTLAQLLDRINIKYLDLYQVLRADLYHDNLHPNRAGHKFIGEYLSVEIPKMFPEIFNGS